MRPPGDLGNGYATEAATATLDFGFCRAGLDEVVSLMQRLGMSRNPTDDFEHPRIPPGHRLRPDVGYRISRQRGTARRAEAAVSNG